MNLERQLHTSKACNTLESIDGDVNVDITLNAEFTALCPFEENVVDEYDLTVEYAPREGYVIETASFREFIDMFGDIKASQERLATFIHRVLFAHYDPDWITVRVEGEHDGIEVVSKKTRVER